MKKISLKLSMLIVAVGLLASCANWNGTQKGAAIGTGAGAAAGALIGHWAGNAAVGSAIGAAVGGGTGAVIGHNMDKQAQAIQETVPGAEVETVNDGQAIEITFDAAGDGITFPTNSSTLSSQSKENLDKLVGIFQDFPDTYLDVKGHTDDTGAADYNLALSERRAKSVTNYLISKGVDKNRLMTEWFGEEQPRVPNDSEANRTKNRRVEILIVPNEKMIQDAKEQAGE